MTFHTMLSWRFSLISTFFLLFSLTGCREGKQENLESPTSGEPTAVSTSTLQSLKLDHTETTDNDLATICSEHPELRELTLSGTHITDAGLEHLTKLKKLKKIRLSKTGVTDAGMWFVGKCEHLEDLDLSQTGIGDFGVWQLVSLPRLKRLNLYLTKVTDSGLDSFGERDHRSARKITWLNLDKCPISDAGIPKLASLTALEWMHLGGTALTDEGLKELVRLKTLKEVIITKTETTTEAIERLREEMPDCRIRDNISEQTPQAEIDEAAEYRKTLAPLREQSREITADILRQKLREREGETNDVQP